MNILLLSNRYSSPDLKAKLQNLTGLILELGHSYTEGFFSEIDSLEFINNFDCCIFEYSLANSLNFELYSKIKIPIILILNERQLSSNFTIEPFSFLNEKAENKLKYLSSASSFITYSSENKHYFSSFLIQSIRYPTENREFLINQFFENSKDNLFKLKNILKEISEQSSFEGEDNKSRAAFAYLYERAENPVNSSAEVSSNIELKTISQDFVVPSENCQKIGVRLQSNLSLEIKLFDENSNLISSKQILESKNSSKQFQGGKFSQPSIIWLDIKRKWLSLVNNSEIKGGKILRIELIPLNANLPDKNNILFHAFLDSDFSYPYINSVHEGLPLKIYFSFAEFSPSRRFVVLALRGIRMLRDGEWRRFASALVIKGLSFKTKIFNNS